MDYTVHGIFQTRILEWVAFPFSGDLSNTGIEPRSPALWTDSLPTELPGKPTVKERQPIIMKGLKRDFGGKGTKKEITIFYIAVAAYFLMI